MLVLPMTPPTTAQYQVPKRPKLSLQTTLSSMNYGTASKALSTIAVPNATTTPTTINTFNNTFDLTYRLSPSSTTISPIVQPPQISRPQSPHPSKRVERAHHVHLPYGVKSILKKTGHATSVHPSAVSASPRTRKVFFPAPKKVAFRRELEEIITTKIHVVRHSDLSDSTDSDDSDDQNSDEESDGDHQSVQLPSAKSSESQQLQVLLCPTKKRKCNGEGEEALSVTVESEQPVIAATPRTCKKKRRWEWTLAPVRPSEETDQSLSRGEGTSPPGESLDPGIPEEEAITT